MLGWRALASNSLEMSCQQLGEQPESAMSPIATAPAVQMSFRVGPWVMHGTRPPAVAMQPAEDTLDCQRPAWQGSQTHPVHAEWPLEAAWRCTDNVLPTETPPKPHLLMLEGRWHGDQVEGAAVTAAQA